MVVHIVSSRGINAKPYSIQCFSKRKSHSRPSVSREISASQNIASRMFRYKIVSSYNSVGQNGSCVQSPGTHKSRTSGSFQAVRNIIGTSALYLQIVSYSFITICIYLSHGSSCICPAYKPADYVFVCSGRLCVTTILPDTVFHL